jgi:hypothetical protein
MGVWGAKLYENDDALDVKDRFDELRKGKTVEEITKELIDEYSCVMDDIYCAPAFWFALADIQWNLGRLLPEVKEQALAWLDKGGDLAVWQEENPPLAVTREKVLRELHQKLSSPQPPEKKISQYRLYKCKWKIGDVFAYQLESLLAKEKGLFGRHFLFQKVDEGTWHPGHVIPIVYVKITEDEQLPACKEDFDRLEYVQTSSSTFDLSVEEFRPAERSLTEEELLRKSEQIKSELKFDGYGYLPSFRIRLLSTSKKIIPKKLVYVGNFTDNAPPEIEYVRKSKASISALPWEKFNKTIEIDLIKKYLNFNKRQARIYNLKGALWQDEIKKLGFEQCEEPILSELNLLWHQKDFKSYVNVYEAAEVHISGSELCKTRYEFAVKIANKTN